tara:strand:+ start:49 stop:756 length:708 start_codon:yes stop_codon:yes gene_type:complete
MSINNKDLYKLLGVDSQATHIEIKSAYRKLVKEHHPDAGGSDEIILSINAAWEILKDEGMRRAYDQKRNIKMNIQNEAQKRGIRNAQASAVAKATQARVSSHEKDLVKWFTEVYSPIDRLLGEIINPFPKQLKNLSADPYDDNLMSGFCNYLKTSQKKLQKVVLLYRSSPIPNFAHELGLNLYQCLSQVEDALNEFERYTMGYVDSYLNDGREMLRTAKQKRKDVQEEKRRLKIS